MKKVLVMCIALVLAVSAVIGGTVAYLTDTDSQVNVAVVGNVDIEQLELQRAEGVAHNAGEAGAGNGVKEGALEPFEQWQPLYPAFPVNGEVSDYTAEATDLFYWGDYVYSGTAGNGLWNDEKLKGAMDKMIFVENTGSSECFFRTWIAFECPDGTGYSQGPDKEFMMNVNGSTVYKWDPIGYAEIDGTLYWIECATYQNALAAGNTSHPSLLQVVMTHNATNETVKDLGDSYEILAFTQAVQTQNFENAEQALNAAFNGAPALTNHPWIGAKIELPEKWPEGVPKAAVDVRESGDLPIGGTFDGADINFNVEEGTTMPIQSGIYTFKTTESAAEAAQNKYANWLVDYCVIFDGEEDINQNIAEGKVDVALLGQYEGFPWIAVYAPVKAHDEIMLLGSTGMKGWTYADIASGVETFECGVSVNPYKDPDLTVAPFDLKVELRLINPADDTDYFVICEKDFSWPVA